MSYEKIVDDIAGQITNCEKYKLISDKTPGFHVGFHREGKCVYEINKGLEDIKGKKEIDQHSIFNLASMNKIVIHHYLTQTQPCIGDKKVSSFLECNIPELTIHHLFFHQGGLPQLFDFITPEKLNSISLSDIATLFLSKKNSFQTWEHGPPIAIPIMLFCRKSLKKSVVGPTKKSSMNITRKKESIFIPICTMIFIMLQLIGIRKKIVLRVLLPKDRILVGGPGPCWHLPMSI